MRLFLEVQRTLGVKDRTAYEFGGARERKCLTESWKKTQRAKRGAGGKEAIFSHRESSEARAPTPNSATAKPRGSDTTTRKVSRRGPVSRTFEDQSRHSLRCRNSF
jgi:hypothetical protein